MHGLFGGSCGCAGNDRGWRLLRPANSGQSADQTGKSVWAGFPINAGPLFPKTQVRSFPLAASHFGQLTTSKAAGQSALRILHPSISPHPPIQYRTDHNLAITPRHGFHRNHEGDSQSRPDPRNRASVPQQPCLQYPSSDIRDAYDPERSWRINNECEQAKTVEER